MPGTPERLFLESGSVFFSRLVAAAHGLRSGSGWPCQASGEGAEELPSSETPRPFQHDNHTLKHSNTRRSVFDIAVAQLNDI